MCSGSDYEPDSKENRQVGCSLPPAFEWSLVSCQDYFDAGRCAGRVLSISFTSFTSFEGLVLVLSRRGYGTDFPAHTVHAHGLGPWAGNRSCKGITSTVIISKEKKSTNDGIDLSFRLLFQKTSLSTHEYLIYMAIERKNIRVPSSNHPAAAIFQIIGCP